MALQRSESDPSSSEANLFNRAYGGPEESLDVKLKRQWRFFFQRASS